ncbi:MAG TPA: PadR family transcriptional regulator [Solirubrobacteraceae bacterium]|nr:PadR family transcriptional regulator [Solirubrobacteraceae bacterium]
MSHAESAGNWAYGPWGAAPVEQLRGMKLRWMKGDPRHRKLEHLERLAALRHLGEPFGGGPMWGRGGPFGGGRGRKRRGDVRTALLLLLAEEARNGYQLMQTIEERSGGRWRPSPGSVYPALAQLEDEGLVRAVERDGTKLFEITDAGREQVANAQGQTAPWEMEDDPAFEALAELRSLVHQIGMAAGQVVHAGDEDQIARARDTLADTRRRLYRILAEDDDASATSTGN